MKKSKHLTRNEFRNSCLKRDSYQCVICHQLAVYDSDHEVSNLSVHHIIERRLWGENQGYFMDNGASLCDPCHIMAEQTVLSCDKIREAAGIKNILIPEHLCADQVYDKWGNVILPNGNRLKGDLFFEQSVQDIMKPVLHLFSKYVKYPRTWHCPWSPKASDKTERVLSSMEQFKGKNVVVTAKCDGENTNLYNDYIHCRSMDMLDSHPSRTRIKTLWSQIKSDIPDGWRISMENLQGRHTIAYNNLSDWALLFAVWDDKNICRPWSETVEWAELLGLSLVPVLYQGLYDEDLIKKLYKPELNGDKLEGYVIRLSDSFSYGDFRKYVAKYVSDTFSISNDEHWKYGKNFTENKVRSDL